MKRDRKKRVKSRRSIGTRALGYDEDFKEKIAEREKREDMMYASSMISKRTIKEMATQEMLMEKMANLSKERSTRIEKSKKEVKAKDEDDEFKVAVLDVGMATVKVL